MKCQRDIHGGITCRATVRRYMRRPRCAVRCDERLEWYVERLATGIDALETMALRESARADFFEQAFAWAIGDGPLPVDDEAEYAACVWFSIWLADDERSERLARAFARVQTMMTRELCEVPIDEPSLRWPEVVGRLHLAARMREAWRAVNAAQRAIVEGDALAAWDKLMTAADAIGSGQDELDDVRVMLLEDTRA